MMQNYPEIMRNWYKATNGPQKVGVLLFDRFSNHCLANAVEPLRAANELARRRLYDWQVLTLDGQMVRSSSGLPVLPDARLADHAGGASLFVLPSYDVRGHATAATARALRAAARRFNTLAAMDTGSWLLASAGLLDGRRATIHWDEFDAFSETFDQVDAVAERCVDDGDVLSCGGAMTAFELVLGQIGKTHGEGLRLEVAALFMSLRSGRGDPAQPPATGSALMDMAIGEMLGHIELPLTIGELAGRLNTSQRRLGQEARRHLGTTPQVIYKRLRLTTARQLAEQTNMTVAEIAVRCGYLNPAAMTRAFVAEFGVAPSQLRHGR